MVKRKKRKIVRQPNKKQNLPKRAKKGITLVLSGGGAKGLAHIGVIEVLRENKIPINRIIGTSAGALVGGLYVSGKMEQAKEEFLSLSKWDTFKFLFSLPKSGAIFSSKKLDKILDEYTRNIKIEKLKIPFTAVAFDLSKNKRVLFEKGDLFHAIRASIAIPGVFKPLRLGDSILIDGGVVDNVPADVAREYKENNPIIAVSVHKEPELMKEDSNFLGILNYAAYIEMGELVRLQELNADLIIRPQNLGEPAFLSFGFHKAADLIKEGRKAAKKAIPEIKELLRKKSL
jgi:NTE family protein